MGNENTPLKIEEVKKILNKWKEDIANSRLWDNHKEVSNLIKEIENLF